MSSIASYGVWFGIIACIIHCALFSGLNLAVFSLGLLRLQIEARWHADAAKVLDLRQFDRSPNDPFLRQVDTSGMKLLIVTDLSGEPVFVLDAHLSTRCALR